MGRIVVNSGRRFNAANIRQVSTLLTAAAGAVAILGGSPSAQAGTETLYTTGGALTTAASYSPVGAPGNTSDVRLTTTTTGLTITSGSVIMESLNAINGTNYSISNATTSATSRTLTLGNPATFTNAVSGLANDLIYTVGSNLTINGANSSTGAGTLGLTLASSGNFNIGTGSTVTLNALVTGTGLTLTKTGAGTLVLGANGNSATLTTAAGGFVLNAGVLQVNGGGALGNGGVTFTGNATLRIDGTSASAGLGAARPIVLGANTMTLDSAGNTFDVNGVISGAGGGVTRIGTGVVTFTGANTYTGPTVVTGSATSSVASGLVLTGTNASSGYTVTNSALTVTSTGSLTAVTPTLSLSNSSFLNSSASALSLGGTALAGLQNVIKSTNGLSLGALTRTAGAADFTLPTSGTMTTTTANNANGILGGWATVNSGAAFATSAGNGVSAGAITAYGGASTNYASATGTTNFDAATSGTFGSSAVNTIRITAPSTLTLNGAFVVSDGAILDTPTAGATASTLTGGSGVTSGTGSELYIHQYNAAAPLILATPVTDNGATVVGLTKTGTGTLIVSAANTNTGVTTITGGTLSIGDGTTGSLGAAAIVDNGTLAFNLPGTVTNSVGISGTGALVQNGSGTLVLGVGTSYAGGTTINNGVVQFSTTNNAGTGAIRINAGTLRQTGNLTSGRTFTLGAASSTIDVSNAFSFVLSGTVTGSGVLNVNSTTTQSTTGVADTGLLGLSGTTNTYTGGTVVNAGTLQSYFGTSLGTGPVTLNAARLYLFNSGSVSNTVSTFANDLVLNSTASSIQVGNAATLNTLTFSGAISGGGSFVKTGPGPITFTNAVANTYTGGTVVNQGSLTGAAGSFGTGDFAINPVGQTAGLAVNAVGVTSINSIGTAANVTVNNSATDAAATGTLTFGGTSNTIGSLAGTGQVVLGATALTVGNATTATFSGVLSGTGGTLTKTGTGTQILTGANTYTGQTTVAGGTLRVTTPASTALLTNANGTDIQAGQVAFDTTGGGPTAATIRGLLQTSYAAGFATGVLRDTLANANKGLGYKDDGTAVIVKATLYGDADLDGSVTIIDFNALATNFGANTGKVWVDGDFTYDGAVGITDFNALAVNFGQSLPPGADHAEEMAPLLAFAIAHDDLPQFYALTGVPEPTSLGLLAAGAIVGLRRRRRAN